MFASAGKPSGLTGRAPIFFSSAACKFACYMWEGYTTAHRTRVRHMRHVRLEAGRLQRMRHARARLEIVVVRIEAVLRLLPVRLEIGVVVRVDVGEVAAVPAKHVIVVVIVVVGSKFACYMREGYT